MTSTFRPFRFFFLLILTAALVMGYRWVQTRLAQADVRSFAEEKVREIFKAEVKIGRIEYFPPAQLAIQGIQISQPQASMLVADAQTKQLILGYGLLNLIRRNFTIPSGILLDRPTVHFRSNNRPVPFIDSAFPSSRAIPVMLMIREGEFHYPWGSAPSELVLSHVQCKAKPDARGRIALRLSSLLSGIAQGAIEVRGVTDPQFEKYELEVQLKNVEFSPASKIPLKKINGKLLMSEKLIQIVGLSSLFHDWEVSWKGEIENWQTQPKISLEVANKKGKTPFRFSLQMDFESEKLQGDVAWLDRSPQTFRGKVALEANKIVFPSLELSHGYSGKGEINRKTGDYNFWFERENRRFRLHSNLGALDFRTSFQLEHIQINHLDWVVSGQSRFTPLPSKTKNGGTRFKAEVQTDYFILEYEPLEDFRGSFELDSEGVHAVDFNWGGTFHMEGRVQFQGPRPKGDLVLKINSFPLETIGSFAGRPVPSNLRGILEGKLKLQGDLKRPETRGYFTIKNGGIEKLDFDRAVIQFEGFPPYLKLHDSKVFKGRNTLELSGAIDLGLANFLHGIRIKGPDNLILWKGMSAYKKKGGSVIEAEKPMGKKISLGLEVGSGSSDNKGDSREENHIVTGPKIRF